MGTSRPARSAYQVACGVGYGPAVTVRTWRCQSVKAGVRCGTDNPRTKSKCAREGCTGRRPKRQRPAHMAVLDIPYEVWVARFGERCGICGAAPRSGKRLCRDHDHRTGTMRGLLDFQCNRKLGNKDEAWLRAAADYLARADRMNRVPDDQEARCPAAPSP